MDVDDIEIFNDLVKDTAKEMSPVRFKEQVQIVEFDRHNAKTAENMAGRIDNNGEFISLDIHL